MVTKVTKKRIDEPRGSAEKRASDQKPWMKHMGKLRRLKEETRHIEKRIEEAFEQIDRESWEIAADKLHEMVALAHDNDARLTTRFMPSASACP